MNRIGIIAEEDNDVDVVRHIISKIAKNTRCDIKRFVGHGCGSIIGKSPKWAQYFKSQGCTHLIILHDLDTRNANILNEEIRKVITPCPIKNNIIVIPIREIEAWLLSDTLAIQKALNIRSKIPQIFNPQEILDPKKRLGEIIYLKSDKKKRYLNTVHNEKIAAQVNPINLKKCSSFLPLEKFIRDTIK